MNTWGTHKIEPESSLALEVGPLTVWIRRFPEEWCIGWLRRDQVDDQSDHQLNRSRVTEMEAPDDLEWHRWAAKSGETELEILPVLPNRPVVARPIG